MFSTLKAVSLLIVGKIIAVCMTLTPIKKTLILSLDPFTIVNVFSVATKRYNFSIVSYAAFTLMLMNGIYHIFASHDVAIC